MQSNEGKLNFVLVLLASATARGDVASIVCERGDTNLKAFHLRSAC